MNNNETKSVEWSVIFHVNTGEAGHIVIIDHKNGKTTVNRLVQGEEPSAEPLMFIGTDVDHKVVLLNQSSKEILVQSTFPVNAIPAYAYAEQGGEIVWYMIDGDKKSGIDSINCGDKGSPVIIIKKGGKLGAQHLQTICAGKGHHVTTFVDDTSSSKKISAYVSNLLDGTIIEVGNDKQDDKTYLTQVDLLNLLDRSKEKGDVSVPNNAFPHGMVYSEISGRLYCLNNGYQNLAVINPVSNEIEQVVDLPVSSNLLLSPDSRYIIGKGADRKTDVGHVNGRLTVIDVLDLEIKEMIELADFYPSTYRFSDNGRKLYVTSASTGNDKQRQILDEASILVFDATQLPKLVQLKSVSVGAAACSRRPIAFSGQRETHRVFVPNPTDGTLTVLDENDDIIETVNVFSEPAKEYLFSYWGSNIHGC